MEIFTKLFFFGTAFTSDVTSQPNRRERGGASDSKNPDPHYSCNGSWIKKCLSKLVMDCKDKKN